MAKFVKPKSCDTAASSTLDDYLRSILIYVEIELIIEPVVIIHYTHYYANFLPTGGAECTVSNKEQQKHN